MKVTADREVCATSGQCAISVPTVFAVRGDEAAVEVITPEPPPELEEAVRQAAWRCPVAAIVVRD
jgi:ferredoxin